VKKAAVMVAFFALLSDQDDSYPYCNMG